MIARITEDGMWRVTYGELTGLTFEQLKERQPMKFNTILPGNPNPGDYKLTNFSPYKVHQRLATKMRVGRILLAADAAHCMLPLAQNFASGHSNE
jgi:2-polyprenyl-6-methoxyphenol hydroxylase-like FAD-dependent oxidoreductase